MSTPGNDADPVCCVEVRFLDCIICRMQTTDRARAERYVEATRRQYWGAQVTLTEGECPDDGTELPANSALWPLTVK